VARSYSDGSAICYVLPRFVDDATFSHNGANGPETKTTRMFRSVRQMAAQGAKSTVSDCILLLKQDAVGDGKVRPDSVTWRTGRNIRVVFDSGPFAPLCENFYRPTRPKYVIYSFRYVRLNSC